MERFFNYILEQIYKKHLYKNIYIKNIFIKSRLMLTHQ